ncbi:hypothetical protein VKT23_000754 [Stygiomarasmius scandens]|uniref:Uncharacterized protein n=1 Tax=Marasmiellus scandens TaxID=2682957 RepID=A0ABR1K6Y7_9AGAR
MHCVAAERNRHHSSLSSSSSTNSSSHIRTLYINRLTSTPNNTIRLRSLNNSNTLNSPILHPRNPIHLDLGMTTRTPTKSTKTTLTTSLCEPVPMKRATRWPNVSRRATRRIRVGMAPELKSSQIEGRNIKEGWKS